MASGRSKAGCLVPKQKVFFILKEGFYSCRQRNEKWLGRKDSNLGMAESKSASLPLADAPTNFITV
jgi:hypothetical protein